MRTFLVYVINSVLIEVSVKLQLRDFDRIKDDSWRLRDYVVEMQRRRGMIENATFLIFIYTHAHIYLYRYRVNVRDAYFKNANYYILRLCQNTLI